MVLLVILAILRGIGWLFSSGHQCKGRNNDADYNTPGEGLAAGLAHLGEDVYRWTGPAAAVVLAGICAWAMIAFVAGRQG
ncbi:hypothetical protein O1L60_41975 [Streptomyces diastatochromogenes]|nr:hypothetical protein [Streptomyces diastatochromogenes]